MKKVILTMLIAVMAIFSASANSEADSNENIVEHPYFFVAQYKMDNFNYAKFSSSYGLGIYGTSISHWGRFHVGANLDFSINAGILDDWGCIIDFGPSGRVDINKYIFLNMPVDVVCGVTFPEGGLETKASWGMRIAPSLHAFLSKKIGVFVGPQLNFGFYKGTKASFGMQAGISYSV